MSMSSCLPQPGRSDERARVIARRLARFVPRYRTTVADLAACHPRLADLSVSFPALLFALAVPRRGFDPAPVIAATLAGVPLKVLGGMAALAPWTRRLMPEAFDRPIGLLPSDPFFGVQIANHLPRSPKLAACWLTMVSEADALAGSAFAIWIAREMIRDAKAVKEHRIRLVGLHAWFSGRRRTLAGSLITAPWSADLHFSTAAARAIDWHESVAAVAWLGRAQVADMWFVPGTVDGFTIAPLATADALLEEAAAMQHCVRSYADKVAHNRARIWSVTRAGQRVATLEVARRYREPYPSIVQIRGAGNEAVVAAVWWAARKWLDRQIGPESQPRPLVWNAVYLDRTTWFELWKPYWTAQRRIPSWLSLSPDSRALNRLSG